MLAQRSYPLLSTSQDTERLCKCAAASSLRPWYPEAVAADNRATAVAQKTLARPLQSMSAVDCRLTGYGLASAPTERMQVFVPFLTNSSTCNQAVEPKQILDTSWICAQYWRARKMGCEVLLRATKSRLSGRPPARTAAKCPTPDQFAQTPSVN